MIAVLAMMAVMPVMTPTRLPPEAAAITLKSFNRDHDDLRKAIAVVTQKRSVLCREHTFKADCNTCREILCTDGETEWSAGIAGCTALACPPVKRPYNAKDWEGDR